MWLDINPRLSTPIYQQLVDGVKEAIAQGMLLPGERMPTVRKLALELSLNPNTVAKAYQKLEQEGIIETMRSRGTYIASPSVVDKELAHKRLGRLIEKVLVEAYHLGLSPAEVKQLVADKLDEWEVRGRK